MGRRVYDGRDNGLYLYGTFEKFMQGKKAESIRRNFSVGGPLYQIWMLEGVAVDYRNSDGGMSSGRVTVDLYGKSELIGNVEEIILGAARGSE